MSALGDVLIDFNHQYKILHVSAKQKIVVSSEAELDLFCQFVRDTMTANGDGPGYMIVDMSRIVIDPSLVHTYAEHVRALVGRYIHPNGIARYGYELTRLTALHGYREIAGNSPNFFATEAEARAFILAQAELDATAGEDSSARTRTGSGNK